MSDMNAAVSELQRLLENLIRFGTILEVKDDLCRVKSGKLESTWIRWISLRAGNVKTWWQPSIGEQGIMFSPSGDTTAAVVLVGIYSDDNPAPSLDPNLHRTDYPDGAVIDYDFGNHVLKATLPAGSKAIITANDITANADTVTSNAPLTTCTGDLVVEKNLTVNGLSAMNAGMTVKAGAGGGAAAQIQGTLESTDDLIANGISLINHVHPENDGGGPTGAPQ